jgi:hypothetical protein
MLMLKSTVLRFWLPAPDEEGRLIEKVISSSYGLDD